MTHETDVVDLRPGKADRLVRLARELPLQQPGRGLAGEILDPFELLGRQLLHLVRQTQHPETHVARLVGQNAPANLADERIRAVVGQHAEQRDGQRFRHELRADRLQIPLRHGQDVIEEVLEARGQRIGHPHLVVQVTGQHLRVARFVHDLRRHEEFGVDAGHEVRDLAADHERELFAVHELADPPRGEVAVEFEAALVVQSVPILRAVDVDQPVGQNPAVRVAAGLPVDVGRGVPLVALGLFVQAAHVLVFDVEELGEDGFRGRGDRMRM